MGKLNFNCFSHVTYNVCVNVFCKVWSKVKISPENSTSSLHEIPSLIEYYISPFI